MLDLESAICKEEALAYSFGERYKRLGEPVGDLQELEAEHRQMAEWLKELLAWRQFGKNLGHILASYMNEEQINRILRGDIDVSDD